MNFLDFKNQQIETVKINVFLNVNLEAFECNLNYLNQGNVGTIPPTDSRFRPDVLALEENNLKVANDEKYRILKPAYDQAKK